MGDLMCPENCGGFIRTIHVEIASDGSYVKLDGKCEDCFCYFEKYVGHEDFKRE